MPHDKILVIGNAAKAAASPRNVICPKCGAAEGERCQEQLAVILTYHPERVTLAAKMPKLGFSDTLNPTDKALITYYAFVMLADSVEANSVEIFGKHVSSQDIQKQFAQEAVIELRKDGLLK